jgi:hypothetical protein
MISRLTRDLLEVILGYVSFPMVSQRSFCDASILHLAEGPFVNNLVVACRTEQRGLR